MVKGIIIHVDGTVATFSGSTWKKFAAWAIGESETDVRFSPASKIICARKGHLLEEHTVKQLRAYLELGIH